MDWSDLQAAQRGSFIRLTKVSMSVKHLPAYLEEMVFRFNRRKNSDSFLDTLVI
jgi:hypothetical protein